MAEKKTTTKKTTTGKKPATKKVKKEVVDTGAMEEFLNENVGKIVKSSKVDDVDEVPTVTIVPDNHLDSIECTLTVTPIEEDTQECVDKMMEESDMVEVNVDMDVNIATIALDELKGHPDPVGEIGVNGDEIDAKVLQEHEELIEGKDEEPKQERRKVPTYVVRTHMGISYD